METQTGVNEMQVSTKEMMDKMVSYATSGHKIIPSFWQPRFGASNTVSAAVRAAVKSGLIVEGGKDGAGKPYYVAPSPKATHHTTAAMQ